MKSISDDMVVIENIKVDVGSRENICNRDLDHITNHNTMDK